MTQWYGHREDPSHQRLSTGDAMESSSCETFQAHRTCAVGQALRRCHVVGQKVGCGHYGGYGFSGSRTLLCTRRVDGELVGEYCCTRYEGCLLIPT